MKQSQTNSSTKQNTLWYGMYVYANPGFFWPVYFAYINK